MQRSSFLRGLIGLPALGLLDFDSFTQYEKVYLKQCFVRGFSYYEGPNIIQEINKSGNLEMVREPENEFDHRAIALYFNQKKIGYLPRESNKTLSILMDTALLEFHAEITHIESDASDWEKIRIAVYALKEIKNSDDLQKIEPYAALYTPNYYSLKSGNNTLTRFTKKQDEVLVDPVHYSELIDTGYYVLNEYQVPGSDHSLNILFYSYDSIRELEEVLNTEKPIRYKHSLPPELDEQEVCTTLNNFLQAEPRNYHPNSIFAININKLLDPLYSMDHLRYYCNAQDVEFQEVHLEFLGDLEEISYA